MLYVYVINQSFEVGEGSYDVTFHLCHLEKFSSEKFQSMLDEASKHFIEETGNDECPDNPYAVQLKDYLCKNYGFKEIEIEHYAYYTYISESKNRKFKILD